VSTAFIFPGQASSLDGAGRAWARAMPAVDRLIDAAAERMDVPRRTLESPAAALHTARFQPLMAAVSLGIVEALEAAGVRPAAAAGHSFGEVPAAAAAGCMAGEAAIEVAVARGRLMADAARQRPGGMVAVRAGSREGVETILAVGRAHGAAVLAGRNTTDQWIVSGEPAALAAIEAAAAVARMPVEGAWHSPLLADIAPAYEAVLRRAVQRSPAIPLVSNHGGRVVQDAHDLVELLVGQLTRGVDWLDTMAALRALGTTEYIICGPAPALTRFVTTLHPGARVHCIAWPEDLAEVLSAVCPRPDAPAAGNCA
jgi:[acyl-carrier-protein] S-malonyltransferase